MSKNNFVNGLIEITGPPDSGKSSESISYYAGDPNDIAFVDTDLKGESTANQMERDGFPFGLYIDLREDVRREDWDQYYYSVNKTVDRIRDSGQKIVIWDTWPSVYIACKAEVVDKPEVYNKLYGGKWSGDYIIRNGEISREARRLESSIISRILSFANTLIITSHLKNHYKRNPVTGKGEATGKEIPETSKTIIEVARLRLWLTRTPGTRAPTALVLKNIDRKVYIDGVGVRTKAVLPFKVSPNVKLPEEPDDFIPNDMSVWDTIRRYWNNPVGQREFLPIEVPNEEEKSIIDGTLTREQKIMWLSSIKAEEERLKLEKEFELQQKRKTAIEMKEGGASLSTISEKLNITLEDVLSLVGT